jgi:hypothetical protein
MAEEQGVKSLKIIGRNKQLLHPTNCIAEVDYDNNNEGEDDNDEGYVDIEENYPDDDCWMNVSNTVQSPVD